MFQTERMRKLKIITLDQYTNEVVSGLHEKGIVQIDDISERIQQNPEWAQLLSPSKATSNTGKISSLLMKATGLSETFGNVLEGKGSIKDMVMSFVSPVIPEKKKVDKLDTESLINNAESVLDEIESQTKVIEDKISALDSEKSELESNKELAIKLSNFNIDLSLLRDSKYTTTLVGRIDVDNALKFKDEAKNVTDNLQILEDSNVIKNNEGKKNKKNNDSSEILIVITSNEYKEEIYSLLRKFEFEKYDVSGLEGNSQDIINSSKSRITEIEKERNQLFDELKKIADKYDQDVLVLKEQLEIEKERNEIFATFGQTNNTTMLEAWVPLKEVTEVTEVINKYSDGYAVVEAEEIGEDDSDVPVLHNNNWYAKPYEVIVDMYAPLKYNEIDPTILVAITLPFFFGFNLTDAFYGIFVSLIGFILYRGMGKVNNTMRSFGAIFMMCGIWAIILGLLTGGFIGDFVPRFLGFNLPTVIPAIDAFKQPQNILIMALIVGVIYTNIGFILGMINNWRYGNKKEAITSQIVWFVLEAGIVFLVLGFIMPGIGIIGMGLGGALIALSIILLLWGGGAYGIMDIFSFMGDILSYARLLALCLATGGIAMTVNILAEMLNGMVPGIGIIIAIFVFLFGHIVNFMFQVLGGFINALRLNYVEFFAQFFMGGKNNFNPFSAKRTFTKIKDD
ncbi:V-type ATP synthase subunit I [Methanobrevibacter sp. TMH8]|uniref:V-type ATP synthase subunit I n=1 Tax=Methanobrevibacter sp. TMH8 TaxID=2848611 RepID=UPI001CCD20EB|nr:V-type ATP synthase subunit I [Methanobrevibacter sp. TMH8]MBZ9569941.1 V-type ATP synthase subunit I [Methanobrevibacter sp. TMH8]